MKGGREYFKLLLFFLRKGLTLCADARPVIASAKSSVYTKDSLLKSSSVGVCVCVCAVLSRHMYVGCLYVYAFAYLGACWGVGLLICKGECVLKFKVGFPSCPFPLADRAPCRSACTLHTLCSLIH